MPTSETCPKCGAPLAPDSPSGLCPRCLIAAGWESEAGNPDAEVTTPHTPAAGGERRFVPLSPDDLAPHFPQLEILGLVGVGGMGAVYRARQKELDRTVAVKVLPPQLGRDSTFAQRFTREARAMARLNHPNIVSIYEVGQTSQAAPAGSEPLYYFIMEYVDGASLRQLIRAGDLPAREALSITSQICDALQYAHDEGVVHRDIKPENVLVDRGGRIKIADFGLAKLVRDVAHGASLTGTAELLGTFRYMAPEQLERSAPVDHRADIYALGILLYELLTGEVPMGRFYPPSEKAQSDPRLDAIVLRALEREPSRRFQRASEVKVAIDRVESSLSATPLTDTGSTFTSRWLTGVWTTTDRPASAWVVACRLLGMLVAFAGLMVSCFMTWQAVNVNTIEASSSWQPGTGSVRLAHQYTLGWESGTGKLVALSFGLIVLHLLGHIHRLRALPRTYAAFFLAGFAAIAISAWSMAKPPDLSEAPISWETDSGQYLVGVDGGSTQDSPPPTPRETLEEMAADLKQADGSSPTTLGNVKLIELLVERGKLTLDASYWADGPYGGLSLGIALALVGLLEFVAIYAAEPTRRFLGGARSSFSSRLRVAGAAEPRISKMAVLAAILALLPITPFVFLLSGALQSFQQRLNANEFVEYSGYDVDTEIMLVAVGFLIGLSVFPTTVGSLALYRIRRFNGLLHGLPLAFAAAFFWPLIVLDTLITTVALSFIQDGGLFFGFISSLFACNAWLTYAAWGATKKPLAVGNTSLGEP